MLDELFVDELVDDSELFQNVIEAREVKEHDGDHPPANPSNPSEDAVRVIPKKRIVKPQVKLDYMRLTGPRGIQCIKPQFKNVKLHGGKGHELSDLNLVMGHLAHWTNRLFPKSNFDDVLSKLETLGHKRGVLTQVKKIRMGWEEDPKPTTDGNLVSDDEDHPGDPSVAPVPTRTADDIFDDLLATQPNKSFNIQPVLELTEEQKERIERNRKLALEKRLARLNAHENEGSDSLT